MKVPADSAEQGLEALIYRTNKTLKQVGEQFPYFADQESGKWETTADGDWCAGHWIGLLWLAAKHADNNDRRNRYEQAALTATTQAKQEIPPNTMFRGVTLRYAGFRGYDVTGDYDLFRLGLAGADDMATLYDERARQIPLGEYDIQGPDNFRGPETDSKPSGMRIGAIDNIYTALPILWRAYDETNDPHFRDIAISHADRHLDWYIRSDGSTWHHTIFNQETGELEEQYNELAYSDNSSWARGQGWNIAGLVEAYNATGAERYLEALEHTLEYYVENSPDDLVTYWDFDAPEIPDEPRDTSAAALVAYGLIRLEGNSSRITDLRQTGERILLSLVDNYLILDRDDNRFGMIQQTCYNKPGEYVTENETVWTDYYVAYALAEYLQ